MAGCLVLGGNYLWPRDTLPAQTNNQQTKTEKPTPPPQPVEHQVATPPAKKVELDRTTTQPGSVYSFESVQLYAGVSGYLKTLNVDIGDRVKKGQVLAQVDVPELVKQVQRYAAVVEQARARVAQMKARAVSARAEWDAARAAVPRAEAMLKS